MDKKEFTNDFLYEFIKYILWCQESEKNNKSCEVHKAYVDFLKTTNRHAGDCTKVACTCSRCFLHYIEIQAQNAIDSLFERNNEIGHCGKRCLSECDYGEKNEERTTGKTV